MLKSPRHVNRKSPPTVCPSGVVLLWCGLVGVGPLPLLWLATAMLVVLLQVAAFGDDFLFGDVALAWCLVGAASSVAFVLLVTAVAYLGRLPIPVKTPPAPTADSSVAGSIGEVAPHVYASNACTHGVVGARTNIAPHDLPTISLAPQGAAESRIVSAVPPMLSNQIGGSLPV